MKEMLKKFIDDIMEHNLADARNGFKLIISKKVDEQLLHTKKKVANMILGIRTEEKNT